MVLCYFQVYKTVSQLYKYIYLLFFFFLRFFPQHMGILRFLVIIVKKKQKGELEYISLHPMHHYYCFNTHEQKQCWWETFTLLFS